MKKKKKNQKLKNKGSRIYINVRKKIKEKK